MPDSKKIKMFRIITNKINRRVKSIDENLSMQEVLTLLNGLNGNVRGNIHYYFSSSGGFLCAGGMAIMKKLYKMSKVTPRVMVDFVNGKFGENEKHYTNIKHQVYLRGIDERHYLNFARGRMTKEDGITIEMGSPDNKALIEFIVEKLF